MVNHPLPSKVSDLWIPNTNTWDYHLLSTTFSRQAAQSIATTPVVDSDQEDILRWTPARDGQCTTKAAYTYLTNLQNHRLPTQGSRSITADANLILQKAWRNKSIPPLLQTFAWRLMRRAVATGERAGRYSVHIDQICSYCGSIENDQHLFFKCQLPTQVWSTVLPLFDTNNLPIEDDGVQMTMGVLMTNNPTEDLLCKVLFILWYIWKARNDNRFQRRT